MSESPGAPLTPEALVEHLRELRAQIPDYGQLTTTDAAVLRRAASLNTSFVQAAINAIGASKEVQLALGRTADLLRQDADETARWSAVEDELRAMLKGVIAANLTRRHRLGLTALQAYSISRQLVRQPDRADLLPHVQEMKRLNRFGRARSRPAIRKEKPEPPVIQSQ